MGTRAPETIEDHVGRVGAWSNGIGAILQLAPLLALLLWISVGPHSAVLAIAVLAATTLVVRAIIEWMKLGVHCPRCHVPIKIKGVQQPNNPSYQAKYCRRCGLDLKGPYRGENPDAYKNLGTDWADVAKRLDEPSAASAIGPATFRLDYTLDRRDWRAAGDAVESTDAVARVWRVFVGIVLDALGLFFIVAVFVGQSRHPQPHAGDALVLGGLILWWSIIVAWRPVYQDLKFRRTLRRGRYGLEIDSTGISIERVGETVRIPWNQVKYEIDCTDGLLLVTKSPSRTIWVPIRAFLSPDDHAQLGKFVKEQGVQQRSYGSG
jgi:hypothetical protein